jgi:UDP-2,4-diacetamido-2,4,6-trideoxy-beta-L-altropyranose hydrolase
MSDAAETIAAIEDSGGKPDWLIVDHYAIDAQWERALRPHTGHLMVIDDLADRDHDCDLLLDQNLVADFESRYARRIPQGANSLLGPRYALLQPIYADLHKIARPRTGPVRRILVYFGASDLPDLTGRVLSAFLTLCRAEISLDVVIGLVNPHRSMIEQLAAGHTNIVLHYNLPSLATLMVAADVAIGAGGATSWERLCLTLPAIVVTLADNQIPVAQELSRRGLIRWLGDESAVSIATIVEAIEEALTYPAWTADIDRLVDGIGTARVISVMANIARPTASTTTL